MIEIELRHIPTVREIQSGCAAGLMLMGRDEEGRLEWLGLDKEFRLYNKLMDDDELYEVVCGRATF